MAAWVATLLAGCGGMSEADLRQIQAYQAKTEAYMNTQQAAKLTCRRRAAPGRNAADSSRHCGTRGDAWYRPGEMVGGGAGHGL